MNTSIVFYNHIHHCCHFHCHFDDQQNSLSTSLMVSSFGTKTKQILKMMLCQDKFSILDNKASIDTKTKHCVLKNKCLTMSCNSSHQKASLLSSSHLFGPLQLVVQCLFGNLHLDDLLPEQLVLVLGSAAFVLHALQLVVQTHRHIFGHLRSDMFENICTVQTDTTEPAGLNEYYIYPFNTNNKPSLCVYILFFWLCSPPQWI